MAREPSRLRFGPALELLLHDKQKFLTAGGRVNWTRFAHELMNEKDISYHTLQKAVAGQREPGVELMKAVADFLDVKPSYFADYRLAQKRSDLNPVALGGGDEGFEKAMGNLGLVEKAQATSRRRWFSART